MKKGKKGGENDKPTKQEVASYQLIREKSVRNYGTVLHSWLQGEKKHPEFFMFEGECVETEGRVWSQKSMCASLQLRPQEFSKTKDYEEEKENKTKPKKKATA